MNLSIFSHKFTISFSYKFVISSQVYQLFFSLICKTQSLKAQIDSSNDLPQMPPNIIVHNGLGSHL